MTVGDFPQCAWTKSRNRTNASRYVATVRGLRARCWVRCSAKNAWTSAAKDGAGHAAGVSLLIERSRRCHEALEPVADQGHQFGHGAQIPVGVGDLRVSEVGGQREHGLIEVDALAVPEQHALDDEAVPKLV